MLTNQKEVWTNRLTLQTLQSLVLPVAKDTSHGNGGLNPEPGSLAGGDGVEARAVVGAGLGNQLLEQTLSPIIS